MKAIDRIRAYIAKNSPLRTDLNELKPEEAAALKEAARLEPIHALCLAYDYGQAKGYQIAKTEQSERENRR